MVREMLQNSWTRFTAALVASALLGGRLAGVGLSLFMQRGSVARWGALEGPEGIGAAEGVFPSHWAWGVAPLVALVVALVLALLLAPDRVPGRSERGMLAIAALAGASLALSATVAALESRAVLDAFRGDAAARAAVIMRAFGLSASGSAVSWLAVARWMSLGLHAAFLLLTVVGGGGVGLVAHGALIQGILFAHKLIQS
jgi:hypothetical protein